MAKKNYYSIHKNKKPKRIIKKRKYKSLLFVKLALIQASSVSQISIINSTPFSNKPDKAKKIIEVLQNTTKAIYNCIQAEKQIRYKNTKRYIK